MRERISRADVLLILLILVLLGTLMTFAYVGLFTRYMVDDYCIAIALRKHGFIDMQRSSYLGWTGRVSFTFLISVATLIGPRIVPYLPMLAMTCWLTAAVWLAYEAASLLNVARPVMAALLLGQLTVFATLNTAHNLVQAFYWESGMLTYTPPLILGTFYLAFVAYGFRRGGMKGWRAPVAAILSFLTTFVAGAFSETYLAIQTTALMLAFILFIRFRFELTIIGSGLAGSLLSLVVVLSAPGNAIRRSFFPPAPGLLKLIGLTLKFTYRFVGHTVLYSPLSLVVLVTGPALLAIYVYGRQTLKATERQESMMRHSLWVLPVVTVFLIAVSFIPGAYGTSADPPWRSRFVPQFVLVLSIVAWSFLLGAFLALRRKALWNASRLFRVASACGVALATICLSLAAYHNLARVPQAKANARLWDQRDVEIRAARSAGVRNLLVARTEDLETSLGGPSNQSQAQKTEEKWEPQCVVIYYGVDSIETR